MNRTKWLFLGLSALMPALVGRTQENGQPKQNLDLSVNQSTAYKGEEYLLMGSATRGAGEPVIAIDPKDPNNIRISSAPSPARATIKDRGNNRDGDDLSSIVVDGDYVHMVWADGRAGFLGAWYARVPLTSYKKSLREKAKFSGTAAGERDNDSGGMGSAG